MSTDSLKPTPRNLLVPGAPLIDAAKTLKPNTGSGAPTAQQQELMTQQATQTANLNLQENEQRKTILNAMQGMRVFRESALSRAVAGNTPGTAPVGGPAPTQAGRKFIAPRQQSLLDTVAAGSGSTPAGGAGASGGGGAAAGGRRGGSGGPLR